MFNNPPLSNGLKYYFYSNKFSNAKIYTNLEMLLPNPPKFHQFNQLPVTY